MKLMNTNDPKENKLLDAMLQQWQTKSPLPPRFQEHVWQRIERAETAPAISLTALFANWIATVLPRPALATAYVTLLLAIGASVGWSQARQETARVTGELSARYAQTVDPYQGVPQP
jgi:hypothetical protein